MNNNRRGFLIQGSLLSLSGFLPTRLSNCLGLDSKDTHYLAVFETFFPSKLTQHAYDVSKKAYMNVDALNSVYKQFEASKSILKSDTIHSPGSSKWVVLFDGKSDYFKWCYQVVGERYFDELKLLEAGFIVENYGYRVPKNVTSINLSDLVDSLKSNNREFLHQTKSISDLNAFQRKALS